MFFTVSPEDARQLARHTLPELGEEDLARLGAYEAACRPIVGGVATPAFTLRTDAPAPILGMAEQIRAEATGRKPSPALPSAKVLRQWLAEERARAAETEWGEAA
ncbi:hypothetical protein [Glycomyces albidus]|uniref:Uncharacterized protein n=1 Tax=Glycomyces albidus TaxID=2656774 RepID=A0A6L5G4S7_9ACTN|nr:hypothetical protein [Glycomyces albidus]MQM24632.1 hypothetical protein [Glycomyces albidus]